MRNIKFSLLVMLLSGSMFGLQAKLRQVALIDLPGNPGFSQVTMANGQVVITRPGTNTIEVFSPVQHRPEKLLWVPQTKTLYATSVLDRTLSMIDLRLSAETHVLELNALPQDMLYDGARQTLLLTLQDLGQIASIDRSNKITGRYKVVASEPTGLALDEQRRRLYVAVRYAVLALNADTGSELARIPAPGGTDALVLDPGGNLLYAAAGDGSVLAIDLNRNVVDHELPTDVKGYSIAYDPAHKMIFLPGGREGRSKMVILSPSGVTETNRLQNAASPIEATPQSAAQTAMKK